MANLNRKERSTFARIDKPTLIIYLLMIFMGWVNIYAAVYNEEHHSIFSFSQQYGKQLVWIIGALVIGSVILFLESKILNVISYPSYLVSIGLLVLVLIIAEVTKGAASWIAFGPVKLQPTEFGKVATALALSKYLSGYNIRLQRFRTLLEVVVLIGIPAVLIMLQPDMGSTLVYASFTLVLYRKGLSGNFLLLGVLLIVLFIATILFSSAYVLFGTLVISYAVFALLHRKAYGIIMGAVLPTGNFIVLFLADIIVSIPYASSTNLVIASIFVSSIFYIAYAYKQKLAYIYYILIVSTAAVLFSYSVSFIVHNVLLPHQKDRIEILLGLKSDPGGAEYNIIQSKIAIGSGGLKGKGLLQGTQTKYDFVPEQSTDFIFCTVGEEWGFIGTSTVIILFVTLILRLIFLAERQRSPFSQIYGYCVASVLFFHFLINIGMTIGLVPVIGIPLPFFSYGGSSLWAFTILLFIFLRLDADHDKIIQ